MNKFNVRAFGLASGILWAACILIVGLAAACSPVGRTFVSLFGEFYLGYTPTLTGSIIGALWGFVDGAVGGIIFAWLYNKFAK